MTMTTTMPIASRRASWTAGPAFLQPAFQHRRKALRRPDQSSNFGIASLNHDPTSVFFVELCIMAKCHSLRRENLCPS